MTDLGLDDFDSNEFDMDGEFDMGSGVERQPAANARESVEYVVTDASSSLFDGLVGAPTDSIQEIISASMPSELSKESQDISNLHSTLKSEVDSVRAEVVQKSATTLRAIEKILPPSETVSNIKEGILNFIGADAETSTDRGPTEEERLTSKINADIENALGAKQEASQKEDILNKTIESRRHFESSKLLSIIATHTESNDKFNTEISNVYYRKSLELQYRQLESSKELLSVSKTAFELFKIQNEAVIKNTALPEVVKIRSSEAIKAGMMNQAIEGMSDSLLKNNSWVDNVKNKGMNLLGNARDMLASKFEMADDMLGMGADMGGEDGPTPGDMAGGMVADFIKGKAGDAISTLLGKNQSAAEGFVELKNMFLNPSGAFADMASESDNPILKRMYSTISQVTETGVTSEGTILDRTDPDQPMFFDMRTHTTLNKVIPSYLSKMHGVLLSILHKDTDPENNEEKYDYSMDKFYTKTERKDRIKTTLRQKVSKGAIGTLDRVQQLLSQHGMLLSSNKEVSIFRAGVMTYLLNGGNTSPGSMLKDKFLNNFPDNIRTQVQIGVSNLIDDAKVPGKTHLIDDMNTAMLAVQTSNLGVEKNIKSAQRDGNLSDFEEMGIVKTDKVTGTSIIDHEAYKKLITAEVVKQTQMDTKVEETLDDERKRKKKAKTLEMIATGDDEIDRQSTIGMLTDKVAHSAARGAANVMTSETINDGVTRLRTTLSGAVEYAASKYEEHLTDEQKAIVAKNIKIVTDYYSEAADYATQKVLKGRALVDSLLDNKITIESLPESVQLKIKTFKESSTFIRAQEFLDGIKDSPHFKTLEAKLKDGTATVEDSELYRKLIQKMEDKKNRLVDLSESTIGQIKNNIKLWGLNVKKTYDEQVLLNLSEGNVIDKQVDNLLVKKDKAAKALGLDNKHTGEGANIIKGNVTLKDTNKPTTQMKWGVSKPRAKNQEAIDAARARLNSTEQSVLDATRAKEESDKEENLLDAGKKELTRLKDRTTEAIDSGITSAVNGVTVANLDNLANTAENRLNGKKLHGPGFSKGGYTGDGDKLDEAGVVHKSELVINQDDLKDLVDLHSKGDTVKTSNFLSDLLSSVKSGTDVEAIKEQIEKGDEKLNWLQKATSKVDSVLNKETTSKVDEVTATPSQGIALNFIDDEDAIKKHHLDYLHFRENNDTTLDFETYLADLGLTQYKSKVTGSDRPSKFDILGKISMFGAIQREGVMEWSKNRILDKMKRDMNIGDKTIELTAEQVKDMEDTYLDSKAYREGIVKNFDEYLIAMNYRRPMNFWQKWGNRFKKSRALERKIFGGAAKGIWSGAKAVGGILPKAIGGAGKGIINGGAGIFGAGKLIGDKATELGDKIDTRSLAQKAVDGSISGMGSLITGFGKGSLNAVKGLSGFDEYKHNSNVKSNAEIREAYLRMANNDITKDENRLNSKSATDLLKENVVGKSEKKLEDMDAEELTLEKAKREAEIEHVTKTGKVRKKEVTAESVANSYVESDNVDSILGHVPKGESEEYLEKENTLEESIEKLTTSIDENTEVNEPEKKKRIGNVEDAMKEDAERKKNKKRNGQKDPTATKEDKENDKNSPGGPIAWLGGMFMSGIKKLLAPLGLMVTSLGTLVMKSMFGGDDSDMDMPDGDGKKKKGKKSRRKGPKTKKGMFSKLMKFGSKYGGKALKLGSKALRFAGPVAAAIGTAVAVGGVAYDVYKGRGVLDALNQNLNPFADGYDHPLIEDIDLADYPDDKIFTFGKDITKESLTKLNPQVLHDLRLMAIEYQWETKVPLHINSGYVTLATQSKLYKGKLHGPNTKAPGSSMHNYGLAVSIDTEAMHKCGELGLLDKYNFFIPTGAPDGQIEPKNIDREAVITAGRYKHKKEIDGLMPKKAKNKVNTIVGVPTLDTRKTDTKLVPKAKTTKIVKAPRKATVPVVTNSHLPIKINDELAKQRAQVSKNIVKAPAVVDNVMPDFNGVESLITTSNVHLSSIDTTLKQILTHMKDTTGIKVTNKETITNEPSTENNDVHIQKPYVEPQVTIHRNEYK